jgi:hypothetical protein
VSNPQQDTADIPLYFVDDNGTYKTGVEISLDGGENYQLYEFDTGGKGFWVAPDAAWGSFSPSGAGPIYNSYGSDIAYTGNAGQANITFLTVDGNALSADATVAQITAQTGTGGGWNQNAAASGAPPLYGNFYGDFGASLASKEGLSSVLEQLGGAYSNGFVVSLNSLASLGPITDGVLYPIGELQIGLTAAQIAATAEDPQIPIQASSLNSSSGQVAEGTLAVSDGTTTTSYDTGVVLDTGAPQTNIHYGTDFEYGALEQFFQAGMVPDNASFTLTADGPNGSTQLVQLNEQTSPPNLTGDGASYVNSGLNAFLGHSVTFDVVDGVIVVTPYTASPASDEPTPNGTLIVAGAASDVTVPAGYQTVYDSVGSDTVTGGGESLNVYLAAGLQTGTDFYSGSGNDLIFAGGADTISAGSGSTTVVGNASNTITASSGPTLVNNQQGANLFFQGGSGAVSIVGGTGSSTLFGGTGSAPTFLAGGAGNATLHGGSGDGASTIGGGNNLVAFAAGTGPTTLIAGTGGSILNGKTGVGPEVFSTSPLSGSGTDLIGLNNAADTVIGGTGSATVVGGAGPDTYVFLAGHAGGMETILGMKEGDQIDFGGYDSDPLASERLSNGGDQITLTDGTMIALVGLGQKLFEAAPGL